MALEAAAAAIYSQDPFGYAPLLFKDYYGRSFQQEEEEEEEEEEDQEAEVAIDSKSSLLGILDDKFMFNDSAALTQHQQQIHGVSNCWDCCYYYNNNNNNNNSHHNHHSSSPELCTAGGGGAFFDLPPPAQDDLAVMGSASINTTTAPRRKRRRTKNAKNKEEIENQRMTHIAVERNRRKQMNEYLALLRSLMPPSYVQRGDQASIIGGAINFVKELEQLLQAMEAHKTAHRHPRNDEQTELGNGRLMPSSSSSPLFAEFFSFPQYSTRPGSQSQLTDQSSSPGATVAGEMEYSGDENSGVAEAEAAVGEIEVTMVESHANVKILARKQGRQLLKLVAGLQNLRVTILHLNVTTASDQMVLYSISLKVEEGCQLNTVDEIAAAVNHMLRRIEEGSC